MEPGKIPDVGNPRVPGVLGRRRREGYFANSLRTRWPFHIHSPVAITTGR